MSVIIGIDPGARNTGIIGIFPDGQVRGVTVTNPGELLPVPADYLHAIIDEVLELGIAGGGTTSMTVRVESINRPNWHVAKGQGGGSASNPTALLGTAQVLGAVVGAFLAVELVPPGRNGSKPLGSYPPALVSDAERRKPGWESRIGSGKLRHQRSAWDVANSKVVA